MTVRFKKLARSGSLGGVAAVLAIGLAGPVGAQPPPGPGAVVGGVLAGLGAAALLGAVVPRPLPPPPVYYAAPPPPYPYRYYPYRYYYAPPPAYYGPPYAYAPAY